MKLYISADMEGTASVCSWNQVDPSNTFEYPVYRRYMTREVAAAIRGARSVEACEVVINDSHWDMRNLLWDELPSDVRVISGGRKPLSMMQGAAGDLAFFTGYHGAAGSANAVLAHTYSTESIYRVAVNGVACSEALLNAAYLGELGIAVGLITGDRATVESTKVHLPWAVGVIVKESIGYYATESLTPQLAQEAIAAGAAEAVRTRATMRAFRFDAPVELVIETPGVEHADFIELLPNFTRIGGRALGRTCESYADAFAAFLAAMRLGGAADVRA